MEEEVVYGRHPCSLSFIFGIRKKGWRVGCHPLAFVFLQSFLSPSSRNKRQIDQSIKPSVSALLLWLLLVSAAGQSTRRPLLSPLFLFLVHCCRGGGCLWSASLFSFFYFCNTKERLACWLPSFGLGFFAKVFYCRHLKIRDESSIDRSIEPSASASVLLLQLLLVSATGQSTIRPLLSPLFSFLVDCRGGGGCLRSAAASLFSFFIFGIRKKGWCVGCHPLALVFEGFLSPSR